MDKHREIVERAPESLELQGVTNDELRARIRDAVGLTETAIRNLASLWMEAKRRGLDMSDIRFPLAQFLPLVSAGKLLPSLVVSMAGQRRSLERVAELPIAQQDKLARGEPVLIWRADTDVIVEKPLEKLSYPELASVIRAGEILTPEQQRGALTKRTVRKPRSSRIVEIRLDAETIAAADKAAAANGQRLEAYLRTIILEKIGGA